MYVASVMCVSKCVCVHVLFCECVTVCVLALETNRSHFKAKLLVALPKVWHLDIQQGKMLHLWRVDLQDCPVETFTILQTDKGLY